MPRSSLAIALTAVSVIACAASSARSIPPSAPGDRGERSHIVVVDMQRAVLETRDGVRAQSTLKAIFDKRQRQLDDSRAELQRDRDEIEREGRTLAPDVLARRMEDWQRRMTALEVQFNEYTKELKDRQGKLTTPIVERMMNVVTQVADKESYAIVLDKAAVPYAGASLDITDRVVAAYDAIVNGGAPPAL